MAQAVAGGAEAPKKSMKMPILVGTALALAVGAGGFWASFSGMILGPGDGHVASQENAAMPAVAFVPVDPLIVTLRAGANARHLRFTAQLEVSPDGVQAVTTLMPRILDVLNGYLRAVDTPDIESPAALARIRAQMLRRVQLVVGDDRVRDLLVTEFVLN